MHVERFAALAHERRLAIVRLLMREAPQGIAASEIARQLSLPPTNLSFHIAELQTAGLVKSERDGAGLQCASPHGRTRALSAGMGAVPRRNWRDAPV